jgi:YesN/AraC family two-component response regulator
MSYYLIENSKKTVTSLPLNSVEWASKNGNAGFQLHNHSPIEIIAVTKGFLETQIDHTQYTVNEGEVILFNPYQLHSGIVKGENSKYICLTFSYEKILNFPNSKVNERISKLSNGVGFFDNFYSLNNEKTKSLYNLILSLHYSFHENSVENECETMSIIYKILSHLFSFHYQENTEKTPIKRNIKFLRDLSIYLAENYAKPITTESVAKSLFLSVSWFSQLFSKHFNCSFTNYLCSYRIQRATQIPIDSVNQISDIAEMVGFNDYCYFSRSFKKYTGVSPAVYFKRRKS